MFCCLGAVYPPSNRTNVTFTPGSTEKLVWSFTDDIKGIFFRSWTFTPSDGQPEVSLATIIGDGNPLIHISSYQIEVEKPATLVLKNVSLVYDGTYQFSLADGTSASLAVIYIYIAGKFLIVCKQEP